MSKVRAVGMPGKHLRTVCESVRKYGQPFRVRRAVPVGHVGVLENGQQVDERVRE